jgi:hypothetical protein
VRFADLFDSAGGGPDVQMYFQAHWSRGRAAQMMGIALGKINAAAQPWSNYTLDGIGGPQYPLQFWGGLLASYAYVECVKQLIRAYTEQPAFSGPPVARMDRRDYADRWRAALGDEQAELKGLLDVFKIRHIMNGSPKVLVSGGTYGRYAPTRIAGSVAARPRMWARWYLCNRLSRFGYPMQYQIIIREIIARLLAGEFRRQRLTSISGHKKRETRRRLVVVGLTPEGGGNGQFRRCDHAGRGDPGRELPRDGRL